MDDFDYEEWFKLPNYLKYLDYYESDDDMDDVNDFGYVEFKVISYLGKYGNCSQENWTQTDEFNSLYQKYLLDNSSYCLNESDENYETYLKIYNSIVKTFKDYNLSDNETEYLKFLIMYYLNNYGNCSNYTWNESDEFDRYCPYFFFTTCVKGCASGFRPDTDLGQNNTKDDKKPICASKTKVHNNDSNLIKTEVFIFTASDNSSNNTSSRSSSFYSDYSAVDSLSNYYLGDVALDENIESNSTSTKNVTSVSSQYQNSWEGNLISLLLVLLIVIVMII